MSLFSDRIKSLRARVVGLNAAYNRINEIQEQQHSLAASLQADFAARLENLLAQQQTLRSAIDSLPHFASEIAQLQEHQTELSASISELGKKFDRQAAEIAAKLTPNQVIRVAFIVQHPSVWPSWRSVWKAADNDPRFSACVVLTPFIHPFSSEAKTYDDMKECLINEGVSFCTADHFDPLISKPHVVFIQNPYEETRPHHLQIEHLENAASRIVYIPYGLELGGGVWNIKAQFDTNLHRYAWRIFARSKRSKDMFAKYCQSGNNHVAVSGHPKFDGARDAAVSIPAQLAQKIAGRKVILWTPHFSVGPPSAWSTFLDYGEFILNELRSRTDLFLLLRPHPLFFKAMRQNNQWNAQQELDFRQMFEVTENFALDESADYQMAFSVADALMTDVGSFLLEYLPTGRPLLYLHCNGGLGMNGDGEIVEHLYTAFEPAHIASFIEMISRGEDPRKEQREAVTPDFLFGLKLESSAGERICDHIHAALTGDDRWSPKPVNRQSDNTISSPAFSIEPEVDALFSPEHSERKLGILRDAITALPELRDGLDIACGAGLSTFILARHVSHVLGQESDYGLLERARQSALAQNIGNVNFMHQTLAHFAPGEKYDVVNCMDVTCRLVDDVDFLTLIDKFSQLTRPSGLLLLSETLSTRHDKLHQEGSSPRMKFRSAEDFCELIKRRGFMLKSDILISVAADKDLVSKLFVFELGAEWRPNGQNELIENSSSSRI